MAVVLSGAVAAPSWGEPGFLERYAATYRFRLGRPGGIRPTPDGTMILFLRSGPQSFERVLYEFDVATGAERVLLTADRLLDGADESITAEEEARRQRRRITGRGITSFQLSRDGRRLLVPLSGRLFVLDRSDGEVREVMIDGGRPAVPRLSPDGARIAYVIDGDLYVVEVETSTQRRLTKDAQGTVSNGLAEFVAQEEMGRHSGFWWSPDSRLIACQQTDTAGVELMSIVDAMRPERPPRSWPYPRPGKANAVVRLRIVGLDGGPDRWVEWDRNAYPYLASVTWTPNAPLTIMVQNRRQTEEVLMAVDVVTAAAPGTASARPRTLLVERDEAWVDLDQRMPHWLDDGGSFLWTTERRGAWQLELRTRDGTLSRVITPVNAGFRKFIHLDEPGGRVWVLAGNDPTETHLEQYPLREDSPPPQRISQAPGGHGAVFARGGSVFVHSYSGMTGEWFRVRAADGTVLGELLSVAETPPFGDDLSGSVSFTTVGSNPQFHAVLVRPRDFQEKRTYPVIVHVYGGPTGVMVSKSSRRYLLDQWIADHGYIVVSIDGRGTPRRGRDWQRAVKHNLIDVPLQDQVDAIKFLGAQFDEMDLSRVGIYGWSFGGYFSAMAVLRRPDVFHAAVAGAPVVDWMDYDTHYTERYMGLPRDNPTGYEASNALTWAADLERPLLIVHGTADDNVYFMHSLKLADALFRAGRPYELLTLAGSTHMVPDPQVVQSLYTKIMDFFETALGP
ncbi:MAG: DPP IV N-terminal domain-containing protein [Planctomycetes bacterium]|nr:DPP IV N-terminal domain-containing protein [Planctomycetota bacterium]